jgi:hypothetical protein
MERQLTNRSNIDLHRISSVHTPAISVALSHLPTGLHIASSTAT